MKKNKAFTRTRSNFVDKGNLFGNGFTLVEMMVVIALIAILALILLIIINPLKQQANVNDNRIKKEVSYLGSVFSQMYANNTLGPDVGSWTTITATKPSGIAAYFANGEIPSTASNTYRYDSVSGYYKICATLTDGSTKHSFEEGLTTAYPCP